MGRDKNVKDYFELADSAVRTMKSKNKQDTPKFRNEKIPRKILAERLKEVTRQLKTATDPRVIDDLDRKQKGIKDKLRKKVG